MGRLEAGRLESLKAYKVHILSASRLSGHNLKRAFYTNNEEPITINAKRRKK